MNYQLRNKETLGDGVRRICREQIDAALEISWNGSDPDHDAVHELRKHLKKARAALRLGTKELGTKLFRYEDRQLRDVGRLLSEIRDAEVRLQTIHQLHRLAHRRNDEAALNEAEQLLDFELVNFTEAFSDWRKKASAELQKIRERINDWPLDDLNCKELRQVVQKSYKTGRRALRQVAKDFTAESFHAFRTQVKELWYHLRILYPIHPVVMKELTSELDLLGEHLGQAHDRNALAARLGMGSGSASTKRERGELLRLIKAREKQLKQMALDLGQHFYSEPASDFGQKIAAYLKDWKKPKQRKPR